jgi:hypothetical protein
MVKIFGEITATAFLFDGEKCLKNFSRIKKNLSVG